MRVSTQTPTIKDNIVDQVTETAIDGMAIGNVLAALTLCAILWVGTSILDLKEEMAKQSKDLAISVLEGSHMREDLKEHIDDKTIHYTKEQ